MDETQPTFPESDVLRPVFTFHQNPVLQSTRTTWEQRARNATVFQPGLREHIVNRPEFPEVIAGARVLVDIPILRSHPSAAVIDYLRAHPDVRNPYQYGYYLSEMGAVSVVPEEPLGETPGSDVPALVVTRLQSSRDVNMPVHQVPVEQFPMSAPIMCLPVKIRTMSGEGCRIPAPRSPQNIPAENPDPQSPDSETKDQDLLVEGSPSQNSSKPAIKSTTSSSSEDYVDALFEGDRPLDLPELGEMTRSAYKQNKREYRDVLMGHQEQVFNTIVENAAGPSKSSEEFEVVPKNKSVDSTKFSIKTKIALKSAIKESMRAKAIAEKEALANQAPCQVEDTGSMCMKPHSGNVDVTDFQIDPRSNEPCSSTSLAPILVEKSETIKQVGTKKNKGKKKEDIAKDDDDETIFEQAAQYNLSIKLDKYVERRQSNLETIRNVDSSEESPLDVFEKRLVNTARYSPRELDASDVAFKNEFCGEILANLSSIKENPKGTRQKLIQLFEAIAIRDGKVFVTDCTFLKAEIENSTATAAETLSLYYSMCLEHDGVSDTVPSAAQTSDDKKQASEKVTTSTSNIMSDQLDLYFQLRTAALSTKYVPEKRDEESPISLFEKALFLGTLETTDILTEADVRLKNTVCNVVLRLLESWGELPVDIKHSLTEFYTLLIDRNDPILLNDVKILHKMLKHPSPAQFFWYYYELAIGSSPDN